MTATDQNFPQEKSCNDYNSGDEGGTLAHLAWWFQHVEPGFYSVVDLPPKGEPGKPRSSEFDNVVAAANEVERLTAAGRQVYIRQTTMTGRPDDPSKRGGDKLTAHLPGLFADVDYGKDGHSSTTLPPDEATALEMIGLLPPPSAIVHSGGGLYPLWRFTEPLGRDEGAEYLERFSKAAQAIWAEHGYHLDSCKDLARILRPVGAVNLKLEEPRPVRWVKPPSSDDYDAGALIDTVEQIAAPLENLRAPNSVKSFNSVDTVYSVNTNGATPVDTYHHHRSFADLVTDGLLPGWKQEDDEKHLQVWTRPGGQAGSIKYDPTSGRVLVWSDTVAAELGLEASGQSYKLAYFEAAVRGIDPAEFGRQLNKEAVTNLAPKVSNSYSHPNPGLADDTRALLLSKNDTAETECARARTETTARLPAEFWNRRPWLQTIRDAARTAMVSPDAVLGAVLVKVTTRINHHYKLEAIAGSKGSLNLIVAPVGGPGAGKTQSLRVGDDVIPTPLPVEGCEWVGIGSGEGLAEKYWGTVKEKGDDGKTRDVRRRVAWAVSFYVDEAEQLVEIASRSGSTLWPSIRSMWSGAGTGQSNATKERTRPLDPHTYRFCAVIGFQPEYTAGIFEGSAAGTPQRFLWVTAVDPDADHTTHHPTEPIDWKPPTVPRGGDTIIRFPPDIRTLIRRTRQSRMRGHKVDVGEHEHLLTMKVAAIVANLDHGNTNPDVTLDDWELASSIVTASNELAGQLQAGIAVKAAQAEQAVRERNAGRAIVANRATEDDAEHRSTVKGAAIIARRAAVLGGRIIRSEANQAIGRHRKTTTLDQALDYAVEQNWLRPDDGGWIVGGSRPPA